MIKKILLFIFIIRDFDKWLISMYNNPYHYKNRKNFHMFLTKKMKLIDHRDDLAHSDFQAFLQKHRLSSHVRVAAFRPKGVDA